MRLYLVRRTRSFIQDNYAETDPANGRKFLTFEDGTRSYFPDRVPKTVQVHDRRRGPDDQYARLYAPDVVDAINELNLPRYGLGNYVAPTPHKPPTPDEARQLQDLSRAGKRLMGFCRTNLFKRLESSGQAFLQSVERHILRNFIFLHAIENDLPLPARHAGCRPSRHAELRRGCGRRGGHAELFEEDEQRGRRPAWNARRCATTADFTSTGGRGLRATTPRSSGAASSGCVPTCSSSPLPRT